MTGTTFKFIKVEVVHGHVYGFLETLQQKLSNYVY